ncbi:BrnT family toxin [Bradyrhizobium icense]|uniref:BrnT family toxin n=1 Tax=Bradyrhizobium icense TaxID=1274631 RepID=UPI001F360A36|nr:BrnT family toxin [Bradyrhizobium icense]
MTESFDHESVNGFEWDSRKSDSNLAKHGIDFDGAIEIFYEPIFFDDPIATTRSAGSL